MHCRREGRFARLRQLLCRRRLHAEIDNEWFGDEPPDSLVREPRRPLPFAPAATVKLELPR